MKTTIELPDSLVKMAKQKAIEDGTTLKALISAGLRKELGMAADPESDPIQLFRNAGGDIWKGVKADSYVRALRKGWK